eukprot:gene16976-18687_t
MGLVRTLDNLTSYFHSFIIVKDKVKIAYASWIKEKEDYFNAIDEHIKELQQGDTELAKHLNEQVPLDYIAKLEEHEKRYARVWVEGETPKLPRYAEPYSKALKMFRLSEKRAMAFGEPIHINDESDLKEFKEAIIDQKKSEMEILGHGTTGTISIAELLAEHLKRFFHCLPYLNQWLQGLITLPIIWLGNMVLTHIKKCYPIPPYQKFDDIKDGASGMRYLKQDFKNWGDTVKKDPSYTFFPKTVEGVCNIVKYAKKMGKGIRLSGFRHSWPDHWADDSNIQVAMLPVQITDKLNYMIELVNDNKPHEPFHVIYYNHCWDDSEFVKIEKPQEEYKGADGKTYANVRVGSAVCGLQILEWCNSRQACAANGIQGYQLPLDVIMSLNTYGGKVSTMSYGAGLKHATLSDLVVKIEYVDANHTHQYIDDPELLQAAAGSIGMLGIITHITFRMEKTSFALYHPKAVQLSDAIPLKEDTTSRAYNQMVSDMKNSFYCEYFWFYGNRNVCKNAWNDNGKSSDYHGPMIDKRIQDIQRSGSYVMGIVQAIILAMDKMDFPTRLAKDMVQLILPHLSMKAMTSSPVTTIVFEALHFRRGINYLPCRCMEILIPIPENSERQPDFNIVQKAWWDVHELLDKYKENSVKPPMDLVMETRIIAESKIFLAPEYGNTHGTCSIEILGTLLPEQVHWDTFKNEVAGIWCSYKDQDGKPLNARFHWGKEFSSKVGEEDCCVYMQKAYKDQFNEFKTTMNKIAELHEFSIQDMRARFSNKWLEKIFGPLW